MPARTPACAVAALLLLVGCSSGGSSTSGPTAATSSPTPTAYPDATSAFVDLSARDRQSLISAYSSVVASCPFATQEGRVIAPADLAPCGPALDHLVTVAQSFQADIAHATIPTLYTTQAATMRDGLQALLAAIPRYRPVSGSRDLATISGPTSAMGIAELEVIRAFSG
jgi:hypothetical protein